MKYPALLRKPQGKAKGKRASKPGAAGKIIRPREFQRKPPGAPPKLRPRSAVDIEASSEVDRVLDKIAREGLQSLSEEERKILHKAAEAYDQP